MAKDHCIINRQFKGHWSHLNSENHLLFLFFTYYGKQNISAMEPCNPAIQRARTTKGLGSTGDNKT